MKFTLLPETRLGKWSVGLTVLFIMTMITFFIFMLVGIVTFDSGHWWDATVLIAFPTEIIAFFMGFTAVRKNKDHSFLVYLSIFIGICLILFIFLHSLFIND